jgi:hypothetical protein
MNSRDFSFWLQGFFELTNTAGGMTPEQTDAVKRHLALVFRHEIDPSMGNQGHQTDLDTIHAGKIGGEVQTPLGPVKYRC